MIAKLLGTTSFTSRKNGQKYFCADFALFNESDDTYSGTTIREYLKEQEYEYLMEHTFGSTFPVGAKLNEFGRPVTVVQVERRK